jgi:eukaryotic-like serine/threonine-protein kinase
VTIAPSGEDSDLTDGGLLAGRYALGPVLGRGASAVVHRAVDRSTGEPVAVKLFSVDASAFDERRRRQEVAALGAVDHPGLVRLRASGATGDRPFVVMDLVDGPTLAQRLLSGPLPADEVAALGARLADALAHVHGLGFVHRDVKPANVLLGDGSRPRLADFGIARALDDTSITATGSVVGTAAFLAPEQVRGASVGPRADVYALGLVLLEASTARREYPGSAVESATARLHRAPRAPDTPLGEVIAAMTASEPGERISASAAAAALAALADPPVEDAAPEQRVPARAPRWVPRAVLAVAATALVGGGAAGLVGLLGGTDRSPAPPSGGLVAPGPYSVLPSTAPRASRTTLALADVPVADGAPSGTGGGAGETPAAAGGPSAPSASTSSGAGAGAGVDAGPPPPSDEIDWVEAARTTMQVLEALDAADGEKSDDPDRDRQDRQEWDWGDWDGSGGGS